MQFYFPEESKSIVSLYYAVTDKELEHIVTHQYKLFPVRFFNKKYFCPMLNYEYAQRVAAERSNWNKDTLVVHILRFLVPVAALTPYIKGSVDNTRTPIVVSKDELQQFNKYIVGYIERIDSYNLTDPANQLASL